MQEPAVSAAVLLKDGLELHQAGRLSDAAAVFGQILDADPGHFEARHFLGIVLCRQGSYAQALHQIDLALALNSQVAATHYARAIPLLALKRFDEALPSLDRAITLNPTFAEAFNNRGVALLELGRFEDALASFDRAIALNPVLTLALNNRGNALRSLGRPDDALASFDQAIALKPDYAEAFNSRGVILQEFKRIDEALASYDRAIALRPDYAEAFNNRGVTLQDLKRIAEALASYDQAIALRPHYADALTGRGLCRLLAGRYIEGWADHEWRWKSVTFAHHRRPGFPDWQGESLEGRHLLVFSEQGLGDVIQFARYLPLLQRQRCRLTFQTYPTLARLLRPLTAAIEVVTVLDPQQTFDFQVALMSLPYRFGTDLSSIPTAVPYLCAEAEFVARYRRRIGAHGFKVGIAWQGNPHAKVDRGRSIPLVEFLPLARLPGVRLISLQRQHGLEQLAQLPADANIETRGDDFAPAPDEFIDTAAAIANLDLVITSDTSVAHLSAALGCPTWVVLAYAADWRWMLDRDDSPWYPSMRLFRQSQPGDWGSAFSNVASALVALRNRLLT